MNLGQRIKRTLHERGMTQAELSRLVGVKQQTISYLVGGSTQTSRYATKIAAVLGVNPGWLQTGEGDPHEMTVPIRDGNVTVHAAQIPILAPDQVASRAVGKQHHSKGMLMSDAELRGEAFALEIEGDSMMPTFRAGDRVVIDEGVKPEPGDYVAALLDGSVLLFRRYRVRQGGFELVPENPDWETVSSSDGIQILGVMAEHRRYRKK